MALRPQRDRTILMMPRATTMKPRGVSLARKASSPPRSRIRLAPATKAARAEGDAAEKGGTRAISACTTFAERGERGEAGWQTSLSMLSPFASRAPTSFSRCQGSFSCLARQSLAHVLRVNAQPVRLLAHRKGSESRVSGHRRSPDWARRLLNASRTDVTKRYRHFPSPGGGEHQ